MSEGAEGPRVRTCESCRSYEPLGDRGTCHLVPPVRTDAGYSVWPSVSAGDRCDKHCFHGDMRPSERIAVALEDHVESAKGAEEKRRWVARMRDVDRWLAEGSTPLARAAVRAHIEANASATTDTDPLVLPSQHVEEKRAEGPVQVVIELRVEHGETKPGPWRVLQVVEGDGPMPVLYETRYSEASAINWALNEGYVIQHVRRWNESWIHRIKADDEQGQENDRIREP